MAFLKASLKLSLAEFARIDQYTGFCSPCGFLDVIGFVVLGGFDDGLDG